MNQSYYAVIPAPILNSNLKPNSKLLYGLISSLANQKGYCYASNNYLSKLINISSSGISKIVKDLYAHGFIKIQLIKEGKQIKERRIYLMGVLTNELGGTDKCQEGVLTNVLGNIYNKDNNKDICPYKEIVDLFNNLLPQLSSVKIINDKRKRDIKKLWDFHKDHQSLDWWKDYFSFVSNIDFLMGGNNNSTEYKNWKADFDFLINLNKFAKIVEGAYQ